MRTVRMMAAAILLGCLAACAERGTAVELITNRDEYSRAVFGQLPAAESRAAGDEIPEATRAEELGVGGSGAAGQAQSPAATTQGLLWSRIQLGNLRPLGQ